MRVLALLPWLILGVCIFPHASHAIDLTGAWATDAADCQKIFVKKGKVISFQPRSELHGGGFIIDGNSIRGKAAKCMLSNVQFSLRVVSENKVSRIFPGMEGMEVAYYRCSL